MNSTIELTMLATLLSVSVVTDLRSRRIPNSAIVAACVAALAVSLATGGMDGLATALAGFGAGLALMWIPWKLGGVGGGDAKLMAAVGAIVGWRVVAASFLLSAVAGGIIVIALRAYTALSRYTFGENSFFVMPKSIPYACAIAVGSFAAFFIDRVASL